MPSGVKNITKVLNQKVAKQPNCFSFFLLHYGTWRQGEALPVLHTSTHGSLWDRLAAL